MAYPVPIPSEFPAPKAGVVDVLIVAGEHSGDEQAARAVRALRERRPDLQIAALGGPTLEAAGVQVLFDMTRFSAVGLVEVLANYGFYRTLFFRTLEWIRQYRPRLICFVDYPGFNLRLAERLKKEGLSRKGGGEIVLCHYISPQIWAWKAKRRFKMAEVLDALGVIFPFEVDCYKDTELPVRFVGHPFAQPEHRGLVRYAKDGPVLLVPGSRPKPVRRIFPALMAAWKIFHAKHPERRAMVIHPGEPVRSVLFELMAGNPEAAKGIDLVERGGNPPGVSATLTSSGTMSLDVALAGVPGATVYLAHPLTWSVGRLVVRGVKFLNIANILLERPAWPEFLQGAAKPEELAARLAACVDDPAVALATQEDAATLHGLLGGGAGEGCTTADWLLEQLALAEQGK